MFDALFQALFSYRPVVFQQGEFRFDVSSASFVAALVAALVAAVAIFTYRRVTVADGTLRDKVILTTLRVAALGLVLFCLFRPTLVVRAAVNQRNVVAVLLDDSRSMQIPDVQGTARAQYRPRSVRVARQSGPETAGRAVPGADCSASRRRPAAWSPPRRWRSTAPRPGSARPWTACARSCAGCPWPASWWCLTAPIRAKRALSGALLGLKAEKLPVFTVGVGSEACRATCRSIA